MKGYFGIGVEGISKAMNLGSLLRSSHAFGAGFFFTVAAECPIRESGKSDTSEAERNMPLYTFPNVTSLLLPKGCHLVAVEIVDDAVPLPSFHHPRCAAYVFGPERGGLSAQMLERCAHRIRIPTRFSVNVGIAGAIVMYDRLLSLGRFARRAEMPGGPREAVPEPVFGAPRFRRGRDRPPEID